MELWLLHNEQSITAPEPLRSRLTDRPEEPAFLDEQVVLVAAVVVDERRGKMPLQDLAEPVACGHQLGDRHRTPAFDSFCRMPT